MPGTSNPALGRNDAILQWRTIMRAARTDGVDFIVCIDEEDFSFFYAFDLDLNFVEGGEG